MLITEDDKISRLESDENLLSRLEKLKNPLSRVDNAVIVHPIPLGRARGDTEIPTMLKVISATAAEAGLATNKELAEQFDISAQTISDARNGRVGARKDSELSDRIRKNLDTVQDRAIDRLMQSLDLMDDEKLHNCKATDLSSIAANMSRVVEKVSPKSKDAFAGVQVILYSPRVRDLSNYDVIDVSPTDQ